MQHPGAQYCRPKFRVAFCFCSHECRPTSRLNYCIGPIERKRFQEFKRQPNSGTQVHIWRRFFRRQALGFHRQRNDIKESAVQEWCMLHCSPQSGHLLFIIPIIKTFTKQLLCSHPPPVIGLFRESQQGFEPSVRLDHAITVQET